jgi:hypothetical protein
MKGVFPPRTSQRKRGYTPGVYRCQYCINSAITLLRRYKEIQSFSAMESQFSRAKRTARPSSTTDMA